MKDPASGTPRTTAADLDDYFEFAPCGLLLTTLDGTILRANEMLCEWIGVTQDELLGTRFPDLLTVGSRIHYETHFAPLLQLSGSISGIAVDLRTSDGTKTPAFITANVKRLSDGTPQALRISVQDASERRAYERELLVARRVADRERERVQLLIDTLQRSLVPPMLNPPDGLIASAFYHTASADDVGGDFYDLFPLSHRSWGVFCGDVSGKGAGAAAVTSLARYTLRAAAAYDRDPIAVLTNLNAVLNHEFHGDDPRFCTVIFGVVTPTQNGFEVQLASGGHPPALVLTAQGEARYLPTAGGQAVGMITTPRFVSTTVHLVTGARW